MFLAMLLTFFILAVAIVLITLSTDQRRMHNFFNQRNCLVIDVKWLGLEQKGENNLYEVHYVDFAGNEFFIPCTVAQLSSGIKWSERRFIRRQSQQEIDQTHSELEQQTRSSLEKAITYLESQHKRCKEKKMLGAVNSPIADEVEIKFSTISKESLVNGLKHKLASKRKETIIQISQLEHVDDLILQLVHELEASDPKLFVRKAASQTLHTLTLNKKGD